MDKSSPSSFRKRKLVQTTSKNNNNQDDQEITLPPVMNDQVNKNIANGLVQRLESYPPGFRFLPTDYELILDYLQKKIDNQPLDDCLINDVDLYSNHPQVLTEKYVKYPYANEWYFFTPRQRKYPYGKRPNRSTGESGYWKATGADKEIMFEGKVIGVKKSLVYYEGKHNPTGGKNGKSCKTHWIMHEYRTPGPPREKTSTADMRLDDWVLCRILLKDGTKRRRTDENAPSEEFVNVDIIANADDMGHEEVVSAAEMNANANANDMGEEVVSAEMNANANDMGDDVGLDGLVVNNTNGHQSGMMSTGTFFSVAASVVNNPDDYCKGMTSAMGGFAANADYCDGMYHSPLAMDTNTLEQYRANGHNCDLDNTFQFSDMCGDVFQYWTDDFMTDFLVEGPLDFGDPNLADNTSGEVNKEGLSEDVNQTEGKNVLK